MFSGTKGYRTKPPVGVRLNPLHPLSQELVGCWLFNERSGSRVNDISGHGNHGTLTNMSPNAQGSGWGGNKFGGGLNFDGSDDFVNCGSSTELGDIDKGTWSAWIYPTGWGHDNRGMILSKSEDEALLSHACHNLQLRNAAGNGEETLNFDIFFTTAICRARAADHSISLNEWAHVLVVWDLAAKTSDMYINGTEVSYATHQDGVGTHNPNAAESQLIGATSYAKNGGNRWFDGIIDGVRIGNQAISPVEIKQLYEDPFCNLLRVPVRYAPAVPGGLPIPVAMNYYRRRRVA